MLPPCTHQGGKARGTASWKRRALLVDRTTGRKEEDLLSGGCGFDYDYDNERDRGNDEEKDRSEIKFSAN